MTNRDTYRRANWALETTAVGAFSSAVAVDITGPAWLSSLDCMRPLFSISFLCLLLIGCATPRDFRAIWKQSTPPPADLPALPGFKIAPLEAYHKLRLWDASYSDTHKHTWHIYADSHSYYFLDVLSEPESSDRCAYTHGVQIEGQQGLIILKRLPRRYRHY